MKKSFIKIYFLLGIVLFFTNCKKDESEGLTQINYFPEIVLTGGDVVMPLGGSYTEPGYSAHENNIDITNDVVVTDNIVDTVVGVYSVNYEVENSWEYKGVETRTVLVAVIDNDAPESGIYTANVVRRNADGSSPVLNGPNTVTVLNEGSNVFYVSCLLGSYYEQGLKQGEDFAMTGKIELDKATNTFTHIESNMEATGSGLTSFQNSSYNPTTGIIYFESMRSASYIFEVTLTK